ncbi:MAG TPA: endonuclease/exonuclease/phosphatase family protein [Kofleriaceae bacterium]
MRLLGLALALVAGCVSMDDGGDWESVDTITGELAPEIGPAPTDRTQLGDTLRVVTWNVHYGEDAVAIAAAMRASQHVAAADVVLVQEIEAYPGEPGTRAQRLAEALGMTWVYAPARKDDGHTHGIAMLARHPLENVAIRELPYVEQAVRSRNRIAMAADIRFGDRLVRIVNVHLDVRIGPGDRVRQLHGAVNDVGEGPIIVGGDFNTNPWAWVESAVPLLATEAIVGQEQAAVVDDYLYGLGFSGAIPVETPTMRLPAFQMRTDDLYARDLRIVASGIDYVDGSDHWPVWFDVALY